MVWPNFIKNKGKKKIVLSLMPASYLIKFHFNHYMKKSETTRNILNCLKFFSKINQKKRRVMRLNLKSILSVTMQMNGSWVLMVI